MFTSTEQCTVCYFIMAFNPDFKTANVIHGEKRNYYMKREIILFIVKSKMDYYEYDV